MEKDKQRTWSKVLSAASCTPWPSPGRTDASSLRQPQQSRVGWRGSCPAAGWQMT